MNKSNKYTLRSPLIKNDKRFVTLSKFTWPFYMYQIAAPKLEPIDVFGKLFMNLLLVNKNLSEVLVTASDNEINRVKRFLLENFSNFMSRELIKQIQDNLNRDGVLVNNSINMDNYSNKYAREMILSSNLETITIYQDAITGEIAPHINEFNNIDLELSSKVENVINHFNIKQPDIFKINKAYKLANIYNLSNEKTEEFEAILEEDFVFDEYEADEQYRNIELLNHDSFKEIKSDFKSKIAIDRGIIFLQDYPEKVNLEFEMIFDQVDYNIIYTSPFKEESDGWFTDLVSKAIKTHTNIKEYFDSLLDECKAYIETKKEKIETKVKEVQNKSNFKNDCIENLINGNDKFEVVRPIYDSIKKLHLINDDAVLTKYGIFIEGLFDIMWQDIKDLYGQKVTLNQNYYSFKKEISAMSEFYGVALPDSLLSKSRYDHINKLVNGYQTQKPVLLTRVVMMLIADFYNIKNPLTSIIYNDTLFINKINDLNNFRNDASHYSNSEIPDLYKLKESFNEIAIEIMKNTAREDNNG